MLVSLESFLAEKRTCLTATQIGALLGVNRYKKTAQDVYDYYIYPQKQKQTPDMLRGQELEPLVLDKYEKLVGKEILRQMPFEGEPRNKTHKGLYRLCDRPDIDSLEVDGFTREELLSANWLGAHPDGIASDFSRGVEVKTIKSSFDLEANGIYPDHIIQCQTILLCTGLPCIDLVYFDINRWSFIPEDSVTDTIYPDPRIQHSILKVARKFWFENILPKIPPATNHIPVDIRVESELGDLDRCEDDPALVEKLTELSRVAVEAKIALDSAEEIKSQAYEALSTALAGRKGKKVLLPQYTINRITVGPSSKIDYPRMIKELGLDVEPFLTTTQPYSYIKVRPNGGL